jgi:hypothetical protein
MHKERYGRSCEGVVPLAQRNGPLKISVLDNSVASINSIEAFIDFETVKSPIHKP